MLFKLPFDPQHIPEWALRYGPDDDDREAFRVGEAAKAAGFLTRADFIALAAWKTPRSKTLCQKNSEAYVRQVTASALSAAEPRFKIEVLCLLDGVGWPTASVILHFCDSGRWPILDKRAFWSLGHAEPREYNFAIWEKYFLFARDVADGNGVSMRKLDRSLWAYSKVNQSDAAPPVRGVQ
jgi:hypothetical protein